MLLRLTVRPLSEAMACQCVDREVLQPSDWRHCLRELHLRVETALQVEACIHHLLS